MSEQCPTCGQDVPDETTVRVVHLPDGKVDAFARMGKYKGWACRDTEEEARQLAMARALYQRSMEEGR
jgi:hypothetical protein